MTKGAERNTLLRDEEEHRRNLLAQPGVCRFVLVRDHSLS